jgi:hypothetical protein
LYLEGSFICNDCDAKGPALFDKSDKSNEYKGIHDYHTHDLVRCQELVEIVEVSVEEQLASLKTKFANHEKVMDDRLSAMEKLLEMMHKRLGLEAN